jgi:rhodanese-related sulfurtransferase
MLGGGDLPVILDVRAGTAFEASHIPGAHSYDPHARGARLPAIDPDAAVIVYCACPNEVSAARIAQLLRRAGIQRVRPLLGGIDAWINAGYQVHGKSAAPAL